MRTLLARTAAGERAGLLSTVFLLNYSSAAIPSLVAGRLTTTFTLFQIACGYAVLVLVGVVTAVSLVRPVGSRPPDVPGEGLRGVPRS